MPNDEKPKQLLIQDPPQTLADLLKMRKIEQAKERQLIEYMRAVVRFYDQTGRLPRKEKALTRAKAAKRLTERQKTIRGAIRQGETGEAYVRYIDAKGLRTPEEWQNEDCSASYVKAYKDPHWRLMIQREKSRAKKRMDREKAMQKSS
jgi:hypothetical protein